MALREADFRLIRQNLYMDRDIPVGLSDAPPTRFSQPLRREREPRVGRMGQGYRPGHGSLPAGITELTAEGESIFKAGEKNAGVLPLSEPGLAQQGHGPGAEGDPPLLLNEAEAEFEPLIGLVQSTGRQQATCAVGQSEDLATTVALGPGMLKREGEVLQASLDPAPVDEIHPRDRVNARQAIAVLR
jgi:hypothetical protein